jgi:hypothetical protein
MRQRTSLLLFAVLSALPSAGVFAQSPREMVQQIVDIERAESKADHSQWIYLEDFQKPREHLLQWVATTSSGGVRRVLEQDGRVLPVEQQRQQVERSLHDTRAQRKEVAENEHDAQQLDDFLKLLPTAFLWKQTDETDSTVSLHFDPDPHFHPPTREARVFSSMSGDMVADRQQHRIRHISGRLSRDVTFGGGLLGKLQQGSSFTIDQRPFAPGLWELTSIRVHLNGNALLFKSVALNQDQERTEFRQEPGDVSLQQAAEAVAHEPERAKVNHDTEQGSSGQAAAADKHGPS